MYAIVKIGGTQYKIIEGQELEVDKISQKPEEIFEINEVLLVADGEKVQIGTPTIADFKVTARVLKQFQGKKIRVARFKSKVRYRKVTGFRPQLTQIRIEKIGNTETLKKTEKLKKVEKKVIKKAIKPKKTV